MKKAILSMMMLTGIISISFAQTGKPSTTSSASTAKPAGKMEIKKTSTTVQSANSSQQTPMKNTTTTKSTSVSTSNGTTGELKKQKTVVKKHKSKTKVKSKPVDQKK